MFPISRPTVKKCADCNFFLAYEEKKIRDRLRTIPVFIHVRYIICVYQFSNIVSLHRSFIYFQYGGTLTSQTEHISVDYITKTCIYNFDPLKPHFYIVKLGFRGVYIIFLISAQKHRLWVLVRTASERRF